MAGGRFLVLDDDSQVGRMMQLIAESTGFEARALSRVTDFFRVIDEWQPTHIALDLLMPDMNGVDVLEQLGTQGCTAGIILTSGTTRRVLDAARRSGDARGLNIAGVLPKPFLPAALRELLCQPPRRQSAIGTNTGPVGGAFQPSSSTSLIFRAKS